LRRIPSPGRTPRLPTARLVVQRDSRSSACGSALGAKRTGSARGRPSGSGLRPKSLGCVSAQRSGRARRPAPGGCRSRGPWLDITVKASSGRSSSRTIPWSSPSDRGNVLGGVQPAGARHGLAAHRREPSRALGVGLVRLRGACPPPASAAPSPRQMIYGPAESTSYAPKGVRYLFTRRSTSWAPSARHNRKRLLTPRLSGASSRCQPIRNRPLRETWAAAFFPRTPSSPLFLFPYVARCGQSKAEHWTRQTALRTP